MKLKSLEIYCRCCKDPPEPVGLYSNKEQVRISYKCKALELAMLIGDEEFVKKCEKCEYCFGGFYPVE